jgi:hypothetical protein
MPAVINNIDYSDQNDVHPLKGGKRPTTERMEGT